MNINYDEISKIYDDVREEEVSILQTFLAELDVSKKPMILDVGCGTGNYTNLMERLTNGDVYGLDASSGMLEKAKNKNRRIHFVLGDACNIPLDNDKFDFIYMTDVIHHIKDLHKMFQELYRILKREGKICIMTQSHRQIDLRSMTEFFPQTAVVDKNRYPDIDEIIKVSLENQLSLIKTETINEGNEINLDHHFLELIEKKGFSMLHLISDQDYQKGLSMVKQAIPCSRKSAGSTLVWLKK